MLEDKISASSIYVHTAIAAFIAILEIINNYKCAFLSP